MRRRNTVPKYQVYGYVPESVYIFLRGIEEATGKTRSQIMTEIFSDVAPLYNPYISNNLARQGQQYGLTSTDRPIQIAVCLARDAIKGIR